MLETTE